MVILLVPSRPNMILVLSVGLTDRVDAPSTNGIAMCQGGAAYTQRQINGRPARLQIAVAQRPDEGVIAPHRPNLEELIRRIPPVPWGAIDTRPPVLFHFDFIN